MKQPSSNHNLTNSDLVKLDSGQNFLASNLQMLFNVSNNLIERNTPRVVLQWAPDHTVVSLPKQSFYTLVGKRVLDFVAALFVLLFVLSWLIPLLSLVVRLDSSGPIFFVQRRSGREGRPFYCFKFRTMIHNQQVSGFQQTAKNDSRVTRVGQFLRKTNLDEMPQFINVLLGDMSLVGPRPHAILHDAEHWASAAYRERYWVRPGITGLAQVRGSRGDTKGHRKMEHRVRYDHLYISRQSFLLDLKICAQTLKLMKQGDKNAW
jgi:putative colanic acid biosynthesis UDP-glucose lipid carrier transferase